MIVAALLVAYIQSPTPTRVACVGASSTFGTGSKNPATQSYPAQLQKFIGPGYEVRNFGHGGATLTRNADNPYWNVSEFKAAKDFSPQIVVINLGTNDARPVNWSKAKNVFVPQYEEMIADFRALPSHPKVYICLPAPNFETRKENIDFAVVPLVKQIARESKAPIVDLYSILENRSELFADKLHTNEEGYAMMAQAVAEAIEDPAERKKAWKLVSADSEEAEEGPARAAIDGDTYTYWHTNYSSKETKHPHELVVDLGEVEPLTGFRHLPRQDGGVNGRVRAYELYLSVDGKEWGQPIAKGEIKNTSGWTAIKFPATTRARFFKFRALSEWNDGPWTSIAELDMQRALGG